MFQNFILYLNRFIKEGLTTYMYATMQKGKASVSPPAMVFQGKPPVEDMYPFYSTIQDINRLINNH